MKVSGPVSAGFAPALVQWQRRDGRHGLPWQGTRDPYRVWLSEIMLQQTQVSTVLGYYPRFLDRFPDVHALAAASEDEVMSMWSGLGYYSRARNLHRCARTVVSEHGGSFPATSSVLATLPGIGDSTAAAIAAFCHGERVSIADGNVRRVLSRLLAFEGDLSQARAQRELWQLAQSLLPEHPSADDMVAYTQGLMDLGAGVCTLRQPACERCPVAGLCEARRSNTTDRFPVKTKRVARRHESWWLLVLRKTEAGQLSIWLERRPPRGIWAGLHCVPVAGDDAQALAVAGEHAGAARHLPALAHALTHRELRLHPVLVDLVPGAAEPVIPNGRWVPMEQLSDVGLPAPVRSLLQQLPG